MGALKVHKNHLLLHNDNDGMGRDCCNKRHLMMQKIFQLKRKNKHKTCIVANYYMLQYALFHLFRSVLYYFEMQQMQLIPVPLRSRVRIRDVGHNVCYLFFLSQAHPVIVICFLSSLDI